MTGNVTRRGAHSWRLKFEGGERNPVTGRRRTRYVTVKGTKKAAQIELIAYFPRSRTEPSLSRPKSRWPSTCAAGSTAATISHRRRWNAIASLANSRSSLTLARSCCRNSGRRISRTGTRRC
jgi:hypothetical protein